MRTRLFYYSLLLVLLVCNLNKISNAQYGYSPFVDSLIFQITDSSLSLLNRQLSGDTTVIISGVTDSIKTRHSNYADNSKAAQFILEKFQSYGLQAYLQQYDPNGQNVVAKLPGTVYPNQEFLITAHYDNMPASTLAPGSDDNASGVAAMLEAARLMSQCAFPYTVKFVAFDEEEQGLIGSQYYADSAYFMGHQILGVFNQDMIAWDANNDYEYSVSTNTASMPFMEKHIDNITLYQPMLRPNVITIGSSDHFRFWGRGFPALLTIEQYQVDYNANYHTVNDHFDNINRNYFLALSRGVVASAITMAADYKMQLSHTPLESSMFVGEQVASLVVTGPHSPDLTEHLPRLYYRLEEGEFSFSEDFTVRGDTLDFILPEFPLGTKVSYYFAVQDSADRFCVTLPEYGKGLNPPGSIPPPTHYSFYVLEDSTATYCATGLPFSLPANSTVQKSVIVPQGGRILDVNVKVSLNHTSCRDISLFLVSPSGREIALSTKNGYILDHYVNTVFDDEASVMITQSLPPYTGSFRPESLLSVLQDTSLYGTWSLKVQNTGTVAGSLTSFCLIVNYSGGCQYVDVSRPVSGDGRTWETALTSITEALESNPVPGSVIFIRPGIYQENLVIRSNGEQVLPLTTGVSVIDENRIQFPASTDLSVIDLVSYPGKYYAFVYRSREQNNGYYQITEVNDEMNFVLVNGASFNDETGITGDSSTISAVIALPVIYRKYTPNPEEERVILDSLILSDPAIYIGDPIGDGTLDALPANFNIIDGIDMNGQGNGIALQIQGSSFNVIADSRIYGSDSTAVIIAGNSDHSALYNILSNNGLSEFPKYGVQIGHQDMSSFHNQAHYTHILANSFHAADTSGSDPTRNAIIVCSFNDNTSIEKNQLLNLQLSHSGHGMIEIMDDTYGTRIFGNALRNISINESGNQAAIRIHANSSRLRMSNNIISNSVTEDNDLYAIWIDATGCVESRLANNTVFNLDRGLLLEDHGTMNQFGIYNNILDVNDRYFESMGNPGTFNLSNNLYFSAPVPFPGLPYYDEEGRQVGPVDFEDAAFGDFRLKVSSEMAICNGLALTPPVLVDFNGNPRSANMPDVGACELENKVIWLGTQDQNWLEPLNWSEGVVPVDQSNTVITISDNYPIISAENAQTRGLLLKQGTNLKLSGFQLIVTGN